MIVNGTSLLADPPIVSMLSEKFQGPGGVSYGLSEAGYDIRIKQDVTFMPGLPYGSVHIVDRTVPHGHEIVDGNFIIASAIEEFSLPENLTGLVKDKSTWARQGLSVFNTVIEPGWRGFLTLELVYHGRKPLHIPAGSGIAQVIFEKVTNPTTYSGKYQDQRDHPVEPILIPN